MSSALENLYAEHKTPPPPIPVVPSHPAEGVGLEPTSPCGQRFSRPRISFPRYSGSSFNVPSLWAEEESLPRHPDSSLQGPQKEWQENGKSQSRRGVWRAGPS